jgi:mRNA-degrading endonuclease RelE of RelBE toxin-antitoxin system
MMSYVIKWKRKAVKQMLKFPASDSAKITASVKDLENENNWGNVKSLKNHQYDYRLRIGRYRVLFNCSNDIQILSIEEVKKRDERTY